MKNMLISVHPTQKVETISMVNDSLARVGIGVVGAGTVVEMVHLPSLKEIPEAELIAVADIRERRAIERFLRDLG